MIVDLSLQKESSQSRETLPTLPRKFQLIVQGDPTATVVGTARVFGTNPATAQIITEFNLAALLALSANPGSLEDSASQKVKKPILSNREREIAILVGQGFKNKEISEALFIGDQTVKNHLGNIFYKLKIEDRWQLMPSDPDSNP